MKKHSPWTLAALLFLFLTGSCRNAEVMDREYVELQTAPTSFYAEHDGSLFFNAFAEDYKVNMGFSNSNASEFPYMRGSLYIIREPKMTAKELSEQYKAYVDDGLSAHDCVRSLSVYSGFHKGFHMQYSKGAIDGIVRCQVSERKDGSFGIEVLFYEDK